ncbi:MAG: hypothetical protein METHP_01008 [Methanoregula sp. SKADARSKE-2]|nr:MAG: hypothetical protein METHP_01008 [Methanoregula sp. SKADARSKE-2]
MPEDPVPDPVLQCEEYDSEDMRNGTSPRKSWVLIESNRMPPIRPPMTPAGRRWISRFRCPARSFLWARAPPRYPGHKATVLVMFAVTGNLYNAMLYMLIPFVHYGITRREKKRGKVIS